MGWLLVALDDLAVTRRNLGWYLVCLKRSMLSLDSPADAGGLLLEARDTLGTSS